MITLPGKKWLQTNRSKIFGNLWATFNIDLQSSLGILKVSPRFKVNTSTADVATLDDAPCAFEYFSGAFYGIAGARVYKGGANPGDAFAADTGTNAQTTYSSHSSDLELFNSQLFSTTATEVWSLTGTTWTQRGGAASLGGSTNHMLCYFKTFNRLYVLGTDDKVYSFDTGYSLATSGDYTIDFATSQQFSIRCIKATSDSLWIGAGAQLNPQAKGKVIQWDGISAQPTREYFLKGNACVSIVIMNNLPYALDSLGILYAFTGSSFEEIGRFPKNELDISVIYGNEGFIHPNGMIATKNDTILIFVDNANNDTGSTVSENLPSGVWEWSKEYGLVHRQSLSYNPMATAVITDYGQNRINKAGALFDADVGSTGNGSLMAGAVYYTDATTTKAAIFVDDSNDTVQKFGYFVTTWLLSANLTEKWAKIAAKYRQLLDSADRITIKYRTRDTSATSISMTWVNTTSFTTTTDVSGMLGYEVEILQGTGSGKCAHITAVTGSGTYTVTIDEAVTGVTTGTAKARVQNWTKLCQVADQTTESIIRELLKTSERIQIKCTMLFTGEDEFNELVVINQPGTLLQ